jgi:protein transport protein SEC24
MGQQGLKNRVAFDIFLTCPQKSDSLDLASMSAAAQLTGGEVYLFPRFQAHRNGEKLYYELFRNLSRVCGSEVQIRARCSKGFSVTEYFGGFGVRNAVEFRLSQIDADKTFGFKLRNDRTWEE